MLRGLTRDDRHQQVVQGLRDNLLIRVNQVFIKDRDQRGHNRNRLFPAQHARVALEAEHPIFKVLALSAERRGLEGAARVQQLRPRRCRSHGRTRAREGTTLLIHTPCHHADMHSAVPSLLSPTVMATKGSDTVISLQDLVWELQGLNPGARALDLRAPAPDPGASRLVPEAPPGMHTRSFAHVPFDAKLVATVFI